MSSSAVPGVLMRLAEPNQGVNLESIQLSSQSPCPNVQNTYTAVADDGEKPSRLALYVLSDISPLLSSSEFYDNDVTANLGLTVSWVVCSFINGRDNGAPMNEDPSTVQRLPHEPVAGSKLVVVGSTPRPEKETDYHDWYNIEHGPGLATVPGWNAGRRYSLQKTYGGAETGHFYGLNYYDEQSGLGGPIWHKSTKTEWTFRIRANAAKPNIRRVWRIENV